MITAPVAEPIILMPAEGGHHDPESWLEWAREHLFGKAA